MTFKTTCSRSLFGAILGILAATPIAQGWQETKKPGSASSTETTFREQIEPLLKTYCLRCHNPDKMESGIRVDLLDGNLEDRNLFLWEEILSQVEDEAMPPEDEPQPTAEQRRLLAEWIPLAIGKAKARNTQKNGSVRRLTVSQYRNTLKDLLGLEEDLTDVLPPDTVSKDGFSNNGQAMILSPLQIESYFDIAAKALDLCLVDEQAVPVIQNFRLDLGASINPKPCPDKLILGAGSHLLKNQDFQVTELSPVRPFDYQPFFMRTAYEFTEGYQGNSTVRGLRKYDSIYHSVFACMRGTGGYPKGKPYQAVPDGLLLRPAIPSAEIFGRSSTLGPMANFKISLRELPKQGNFRVTVKAARYDDGLLLNANEAVSVSAAEIATPNSSIVIPKEGIYQVDVDFVPTKKRSMLSLEMGSRHFSGNLIPANAKSDAAKTDRKTAAFMLVRLKPGDLKIKARYGSDTQIEQIKFSLVEDDSELARRFQVFEKRSPQLSVHFGLRRDCGSTLPRVNRPRPVSSAEVRDYVFQGAINNFPSPEVDKDNPNYLAGIREIGVRSEYTDGRDMPRLLIRSVEFEGPFYESWPPATHRQIFIESPNRNSPAAYAREVIRTFASRAFRRPITDEEEDAFAAVWDNSFADGGDALQSTKDALLVVLISPQFLFLIESSSSPEPEDLDAYELASKLSYFLWNGPPDEQLLDHAAANSLHGALDAEFDRMIADSRSDQFVQEFTSQWLRLDKLDVVEIDHKRYPKLTRDTKTQLRHEPIELVKHLIAHNRPLRNLIESQTILANDVVANYYGLGDRTESGFEFIPIRHDSDNLGGILSQAGILAGLSDGRESNPVKRGAWFARKIIAEPPDDPPPNVPQLQEDESMELTLREKLERHRNQRGCVKCHSSIDPWGIPFETFDAGGLFKNANVDARSTLPDKTEIVDLNGLKAYLIDERIDSVAYSFLKHLAVYAVGRDLTYNEIAFLREKSIELKPGGYGTRDMMRLIVKSDLFLKK